MVHIIPTSYIYHNRGEKVDICASFLLLLQHTRARKVESYAMQSRYKKDPGHHSFAALLYLFFNIRRLHATINIIGPGTKGKIKVQNRNLFEEKFKRDVIKKEKIKKWRRTKK